MVIIKKKIIEITYQINSKAGHKERTPHAAEDVQASHVNNHF